MIRLFLAILVLCNVSAADTYVNSYYKSDGTYVQGYYRSNSQDAPDTTYQRQNVYTAQPGDSLQNREFKYDNYRTPQDQPNQNY